MSARACRAAPGVVLTGGAGRWYATDLRSGDLFELNGTAASLLRLLQEGAHDAASLALRLREMHPDAAPGVAEADARRLLEGFADAGLVVEEGEGDGAASTG